MPADTTLLTSAGGIDPKLRIESGQTLGEVEVSWHEQECRQPSPREPDD